VVNVQLSKGGSHVFCCAVARCCRAPPLASDDAGVSRRSAPGNKGQHFVADPPTVDEIIAVMRHARYGNRLNGLIVVLQRAGLRINEALSLTETDLEERRGSILIRMARTIAAARSGWTRAAGQRSNRGCPSATLPVGPLFCVIAGPTRGHAWSASAAMLQLHQIAL
jgi:hypothetical protein